MEYTDPPEMTKFPSIESFSAIVVAYECFNKVEPPLVWPFVGYDGPMSRGTMMYRGKIKLHGTNAGITVNNGTYITQRRDGICVVGDDNKGFARWANDNDAYWSAFAKCRHGITVFGEWCGPGVIKGKGTAISMIKDQVFAVFAIQLNGISHPIMLVEPEEIARILDISSHSGVVTPSSIYVLPWSGPEFMIDLNDREKLEVDVARLNKIMDELEPVDPWVKEVFGVNGTSEGTVYYPLMDGVCYVEAMRYAFKVKGDKHKVTKTRNHVQIDPEVAADIDEFVALTVTEARLEQGASVVGMDIKCIVQFIKWVGDDIQKENQPELEASDLTWEQVQSKVNIAARTWYVAETKKPRSE